MLNWFGHSSIRKPVIQRAGAYSLLLVLVLILTVAIATPVWALPQMPCQVYGNVVINQQAAAAGVSITAKINGVQYASTITDSQGRYGFSPAFFRIPADDPATTAIEGGRSGDTVQLYISGVLGGTTAFSSGSVTEVDLSAGATAYAVTMTINAPQTIAPNYEFNLTVDISQVSNFYGAQFDVLFDSTILQYISTTWGQVGSTSMQSNGTASSSSITGGRRFLISLNSLKNGISGSGTLATIRLKAVGSVGQTGIISLSNGLLSDFLAQSIPSAWINDSVLISIPNDTNPPVTGITGVSGGGGGGGTITTTTNKLSFTGLTSVTPVNIDTTGIVQTNAQLKTSDGKVLLGIAKGAKLVSSNNTALSIITAAVLDSTPALPAGNVLVLAYAFGPDGAAFTPGITITMSYDPAKLDINTGEKDLYIAYFDGTNYQPMASTVDVSAHLVSANITHFSTYSLLGTIKLPVPAATTTPATVTPTPMATSSPASIVVVPPVTTAAPPAGQAAEGGVIPFAVATTQSAPQQNTQSNNAGGIIVVIIVVVAVVILCVIVLIAFRRRSSNTKT